MTDNPQTTKEQDLEDDIYQKILPTWKKAKPSVNAQSIRAGIEFDDYFEESLPSWVWLIADIAAQRAFDEAKFKTKPATAKRKRS